jgi:TM2 domain-containing membrane protein YozV
MENSKQEAWNQPQQPQFRPENKKVVAGILGILFGGLGIHKFILGYTIEGIIQILLSIITCGIVGSFIGLIEGIIYLTKTDEEFYHIYQVNKKGWF